MFHRSAFRRLGLLIGVVVCFGLTALSVALAAPQKAQYQQQAATVTSSATSVLIRTTTATRTRTPTRIPTPTATRSGPFVLPPGGPVIFDFPTPRSVGIQGPISGPELTALEKSALAVVKLSGCRLVGEKTCTYSEGSGILIHPRGLLLTALHVVVENPKDLGSPLLPEISVGLLENPDDPAQARYRAKVAAIELDLDLALLWIIPPTSESDLFLPTIPVENVDNREFRNGVLRVMGFPQKSNLLRQPTVGYFGPNESGAVEVGNSLIGRGFSGGPLLVERPDGYHVGGVVFYRTDGPVLVQPVRRLDGLRWLDPEVPRLWAENVQIGSTTSGGLAGLELTANIHALDLAGRQVQLEAVAFDPATNQPWPSADKPLILQRTFEPTRFVDVISLDPRALLLGLGPLPERLRFVLQVWNVAESRLLWNGEIYYLRPDDALLSSPTPTQTTTVTSTYTPTKIVTSVATLGPIATATYTPSPTKTSTSIPLSTNTPTATSTPSATATISLVAPGDAVATILVNQLNVRAGPGIPFASIGAVSQGDLPIVGTIAGCSWLQVKTNTGLVGWISGAAQFVRYNVACETILVITPSATETPTAASSAPTPTVTLTSSVIPPIPTENVPSTETPAASQPLPSLSGRIAYAVWNTGSRRMDTVVYNIASGSRWPIFPERRQPDFRPDGKLMMNADGSTKNNLVRVDTDGKNERIVSNHPEDAHAHFSDNGISMVYDSTLQGDGKLRIYKVEDASVRQDGSVIGYSGREIFGHHPIYLRNWYVAYNGCNQWAGSSKCGIYATLGKGEQPIPVTDQPRDFPTDNRGDQIVFMSDRGGNWDVYIVNYDGTGLQQLTTSSGRDGLGTVSPDGNSIAFVTDREGPWAVYVMDAQGSNQRKLFDLNGGYSNGEYDWLQERMSWGN